MKKNLYPQRQNINQKLELETSNIHPNQWIKFILYYMSYTNSQKITLRTSE